MLNKRLFSYYNICMRRKDREVKQINGILKIIDKCKVCRIAMYDKQGLYIVPMNFGYKYNEKLTLYFHSSYKGRKLNALNQRVAFEMDCSHDLVVASSPCAYSYLYQSVIGEGKAIEVKDNEKNQALQLIMKHIANKEYEFNDKMCQSVLVFKIEVDKLSGKSHI